MSSGSKGKPSETGFIMGSEFEKQDSNIISISLEFLGFDDLIRFKCSMEEECHYINEGSLWYGRRIGSKMMGFKGKTALVTATMFGSKGVLNYVLETSCVDVNLACRLNGLLHCLFVAAVDFAISKNHRDLSHARARSSTRKDREAHLAASRNRSEGRGQQVGNQCDRGCTVEEDGDVIMDLEQMDKQETPGFSLHAISGDQCTQDEEGISVRKSGVPPAEKYCCPSKIISQGKNEQQSFLPPMFSRRSYSKPRKTKSSFWFKLKVVIFPFSSRILKLVSVD